MWRKDLHGAVTASRATTLHGAGDAAAEVLDQVGQVTDGVAVRHSVPAAGAVSLIVEPAAEDEVGGGAEEETVWRKLAYAQCMKNMATYMMINQVKKPQCSDLLEPESSLPPSSQANLVYQVRRSTSKPSSSL